MGDSWQEWPSSLFKHAWLPIFGPKSRPASPQSCISATALNATSENTEDEVETSETDTSSCSPSCSNISLDDSIDSNGDDTAMSCIAAPTPNSVELPTWFTRSTTMLCLAPCRRIETDTHPLASSHSYEEDVCEAEQLPVYKSSGRSPEEMEICAETSVERIVNTFTTPVTIEEIELSLLSSAPDEPPAYTLPASFRRQLWPLSHALS